MGTMTFIYKKIENFITQEEIKLLKTWIDIYHRNNQTYFDWGMSHNADGYSYGHEITDALMIKNKNKVEEVIDKKLLPTYSFMRITTKFGELFKHTDRVSCELSTTVHVGSDGTKWPLYVDGNEINLEEGDALVYNGKDFNHWRKEFLGDWYANIFLHYVYEDGNYKEFYKDKRKNFGIKNEI